MRVNAIDVWCSAVSRAVKVRRGCAIVAIVLLSLANLDCTKNDRSQDVPENDGRRSIKEFEAGVRSYPYTASPERKARIVAGYPKLEVGMTKDRVSALIGEPDYSQLSYGPKGPHMRWQGSSWTYWLSKQDDGVNLNDPVVTVYFGTKGHAHWIVSNVEGLREKGSPFETAPNPDSGKSTNETSPR